MGKRSQNVNGVTRFHDSDMAVIVQHHAPFFTTIQKVKAVEGLDKRLYSGDQNKTTAVIEAVMADESLQLS